MKMLRKPKISQNVDIENEDEVLEGLFREEVYQPKKRVLKMTPPTLQEMQKDDETLKDLFEKVVKKSLRRYKSYFFIRNEVLFRSWLHCKEKPERREMLVVQKRCRGITCTVAHDIPLS